MPSSVPCPRCRIPLHAPDDPVFGGTILAVDGHTGTTECSDAAWTIQTVRAAVAGFEVMPETVHGWVAHPGMTAHAWTVLLQSACQYDLVQTVAELPGTGAQAVVSHRAELQLDPTTVLGEIAAAHDRHSGDPDADRYQRLVYGYDTATGAREPMDGHWPGDADDPAEPR